MIRISISEGNTKMGSIPSVSLVPGLDCANCSKCIKGCYAMKSYRMYEATRNAYHRNSELAHSDLDEFSRQIMDYLDRKQPRHFRWHVAGDILNQEYVEKIILIAMAYPNTKFLCFTKRHDLSYRNCPENLTIVLSCWPGMRLPKNRSLPRAYMQDGTETRIPHGARACPGSCEDCKLCYGLKGDVVFHKH
jgi:ferredoxin